MRRITVLLAATCLSGFSLAAEAAELSFTPVPVPADDAAKRQVVVSPAAMMDGQAVTPAYRLLFRSGDELNGTVFGQILDKTGKPIDQGGYAASNAPDFTSLLSVNGKLYSISHFESLPGAMYLSKLTQNADGTLTPVSTKPVDFSALGGIWNPCAGVATAWGTHLGSEEYPQDARKFMEAKAVSDFADDEVLDMARWAGLDPATMTLEDYRAAINPYLYGFVTEVSVNEAGEASAAKHFAMGRVSVELANVMPDKKTAYISDDGTNVGLFRFVADKEGDLSAGSLYAARWVQTSAEDGGTANIEWVDLGHADDATVQAAAQKGVRFTDLFETADFTADGACPEGFSSSNAEGRAECLKVKPRMEMLASRLETRRYASMLGATTEFRKMEGLTLDPDSRTLFLAMSEVGKGMLDNDEKADKGGRNDIRVAKNPCGAVYGLALDESFTATSMKAVIMGKPVKYEEGSPNAGQTCDVDGIANPDNITFIPGFNTLIIGEDTGEGHQNDAIWALNMGSSALTRIATTPYGAEATSVDWYPDLDGHAYLVAVVQHPFAESDEDKLTDKADARGYVGYIGPFPAVK